jgi:hypothetical protein
VADDPPSTMCKYRTQERLSVRKKVKNAGSILIFNTHDKEKEIERDRDRETA